MQSQSLAELIVKLEKDCEQAQSSSSPQFHIRAEWTGTNALTLSEVNELNVYFNRRYSEYAITIIGNSGLIDKLGVEGCVVILVGHMVVSDELPDVFSTLYAAAPIHLK